MTIKEILKTTFWVSKKETNNKKIWLEDMGAWLTEDGLELVIPTKNIVQFLESLKSHMSAFDKAYNFEEGKA